MPSLKAQDGIRVSYHFLSLRAHAPGIGAGRLAVLGRLIRVKRPKGGRRPGQGSFIALGRLDRLRANVTGEVKVAGAGAAGSCLGLGGE